MRTPVPLRIALVTVLAAAGAAGCGRLAPGEGDAPSGRGMADLAPLVGEWCVNGTIVGLDGVSSPATGRASVELITRGSAQLERLRLEIRGESVEGLTVRTWDARRGRFRFGVVRGATGGLVVLEGAHVADAWELDTLDVDDGMRTGARTIHSRERLTLEGRDGFRREFFGSADAGGTWASSGRLDYRRPVDGACEAEPAAADQAGSEEAG